MSDLLCQLCLKNFFDIFQKNFEKTIDFFEKVVYNKDTK